jgi:hypothetical protein
MKRRPEQYDWILIQFNEKGIVPVIVAGQAVNIWSSIHQDWDTRYNPTSPKISDLLPLTSADMELLDTGIVRTLEKFSGVVDVEKTVPFQHTHSPDIATIHLELNGEIFKIQVMVQVLGASKEEILRKALTVEVGAGDRAIKVRVADPITLLKCKIQNLITLDQKKPTPRQDLKHTKLLVCCIRALIGKTATDKEDEKSTRHALNLIQAVRDVTKSKAAKQIEKQYGIDWGSCIPLDLIQTLADKSTTWRRFLDKYK